MHMFAVGAIVSRKGLSSFQKRHVTDDKVCHTLWPKPQPTWKSAIHLGFSKARLLAHASLLSISSVGSRSTDSLSCSSDNSSDSDAAAAAAAAA
jgi:hypothetical protein